jgi:hypothetical protein
MRQYQVVYAGERQQLEVLSWGQPKDGWQQGVQVALNNKLAVPFDIASADWHSERAKGESSLLQFLCRQAMTLLDNYGDAREGRPIAAALEA